MNYYISPSETRINSLDSITETCNKIIPSASTWAAQIVAIATPDPTAPKAGAASLVSLKNRCV